MRIYFDSHELSTPQNIPEYLHMFYIPSFRVVSYFLKQNISSIVKLISDVGSGSLKRSDYNVHETLFNDLLNFHKLFKILRRETPRAILMNISSRWYPVTILDVLIPIMRLMYLVEQPDLSFKKFIGVNLKFDAMFDRMNLNGLSIPLSLTSAGMLEVVPILLTLDHALKVAKSSDNEVFLFIDEPEAHLELNTQISLIWALLDFLIEQKKYGKKVRLIVSTHSDIAASAFIKWFVRNEITNLLKIYDFSDGTPILRELDKAGETFIKNIDQALRKLFWES